MWLHKVVLCKCMSVFVGEFFVAHYCPVDFLLRIDIGDRGAKLECGQDTVGANIQCIGYEPTRGKELLDIYVRPPFPLVPALIHQSLQVGLPVPCQSIRDDCLKRVDRYIGVCKDPVFAHPYQKG